MHNANLAMWVFGQRSHARDVGLGKARMPGAGLEVWLAYAAQEPRFYDSGSAFAGARHRPVQEPDKLVLFGKGEEIGLNTGFPNKSWELFSYRTGQRRRQIALQTVLARTSRRNLCHSGCRRFSGQYCIDVSGA